MPAPPTTTAAAAAARPRLLLGVLLVSLSATPLANTAASPTHFNTRPEVPAPPPIPCPNSNVSCPGASHGCVPSTYGLKWACNVSSSDRAHPFATCVTGAPQPVDPHRKAVLIIGDSVSNGYFMEATPGTNVPDLLADVALVQHAPWSPGSGGAGPVQHGVDCLDVYLSSCTDRPVRWDLIAFNFGLHNLVNGSGAVAEYGALLTNITDRLKATGSKLQYHLTTPMMPTCCEGGPLKPAGEGSPTCNVHRSPPPPLYPCNSVVEQLNAVATSIMRERGVPIVDLYGTVTGVCGASYVNCTICRMEPCSYHYKPQGYTLISRPIAAMMRALLA